jgi:NAD(P)-dependent dehydrogenase (short-subunit alcohol dehydrogenase family)
MVERQKRIVVVTGATRGAGRGIALALADANTTVYVTGRTQSEGQNDEGLPGSVSGTADEINARGGNGVPMVCDHSDDSQVRSLFARIGEQAGRLDILVNNATTVPALPDHPGQGFWERSLEEELKLLDVGLRSHYVAAHYAAPLLIRSKGLLVHTSSAGARTYLPGVHGPTYGAGKAGSDKMIYDMAQDLRPYGVVAVSIWMGLLNTERAVRNLEKYDLHDIFPDFESTEFTGKVIDALARDPKCMGRSGRTFWGAELGAEYGLKDKNGSTPPSYRAWLGSPSEFVEVCPSYAKFVEKGGKLVSSH